MTRDFQPPKSFSSSQPVPACRCHEAQVCRKSWQRKSTIPAFFKAELIHRRAPWKTKESVELATLEWVAWFNHPRLMEPLGCIPPAEAEANYDRQLACQAANPA